MYQYIVCVMLLCSEQIETQVVATGHSESMDQSTPAFTVTEFKQESSRTTTTHDKQFVLKEFCIKNFAFFQQLQDNYYSK